MKLLRRVGALRQERGQDLVELALVLPLLLVIVMIVLDLGRAYNTYMVLTNAAREGARQASMNAWATNVIREVALHETRNGGLADDDVSVIIAPDSSGYPVKVTVQYDFALLSGLLPFATVPLSAGVEMVAF